MFKKKPNLENSSEEEISSPVVTDPFSPSASELIDSEFQELITSTISTVSLVHNIIALIFILCGFKIYKDCIITVLAQ